MKKIRISTISFLLAVIMIIGALASCGGGKDETTDALPKETTETPTEQVSEETTRKKETTQTTTAITEETTESNTEDVIEEEIENLDLIQKSNLLANGVQAGFGNGAWTTFVVKNQNMSFEYRLSNKRVQMLSYLNNANGQPYFEDSFDVFVTMEDGKTYYASESTADSLINVFRFGYYYDEVRAENQNFVYGSGKNKEPLPALSLARIFHTYSDKLHTVAQIAASEQLTGIQSIGFRIEIPTKTVAKLVAGDASGLHYELDGVDWSTASFVAFDVKNTGVFGYILPVDDRAGKLSVTIEGKNYVIIQERTPENNTILPGDGTPHDREDKVGNANDFFIGQRIYTDESHEFDAFLAEAYVERNPLGQKNIKVSSAYSESGSFLGYDALRGSYMFSLAGMSGFEQFDICYNRHFNLNLTIKSDDAPRTIYVTAISGSGNLECAVLLDENLMNIPVPIENGKNFGGDNDYNIFDRFDSSYGESIFPLIADSEKPREYTLVQLFQNWGNFPLKQISFIEYGAPYYHLSAGLTETNCLVPWKYTTNPKVPSVLPDHRPMSAPMWLHAPQHTQAGVHSFLRYTDTKNKTQLSDLYEQFIHSYGPTYADIQLNHLSNDDKIKVTYHHIEMPQLDENRGYFTMEYDFLEDLTINDFRYSFYFYTLGSIQWPMLYELYSFLDENNVPQIKKHSDIPTLEAAIHVLGDQSPYFTNMKLNHNDYGNVSLLIKDYEIIINGEKTDTRLAIKVQNGDVALTLDLDDVTFKAGDKITINAIILPWGSQETDYSGEIYPADQNVRDARENSCLNPIVAVPNANCEVVDHAFIPMVKTTNGECAEFTISGGKVSDYEIPYRDKGYNVAVRVYGFKELSVPIVYEKIDGEWVVYDLSSANHLDLAGFGAYYDGYSVYYDEDGTFSYSFVLNMDEAKDRCFKIELDKDFDKWPLIEVDENWYEKFSPLNLYLDDSRFAQKTYIGWFSKTEKRSEDGVNFVSLYAHPSRPESLVENIISNPDEPNGQYVVIKYRFPAENTVKDTSFEIFTSTVNSTPVGSDCINPNQYLVHDGKWHVIVIDVTQFGKSGIVPDENGEIKLKYLRFDPINGYLDKSHRIDIAFFAIHDNLDDIVEFCSEENDVILATGSGSTSLK